MYFIKGIINLISSFLFKIIMAIIFALGTIILYCKVQILIIQDKSYLLFIGSNFNIVPIIMLELLVLYYFISIVEKFMKKKIFSKNKDNIIRIFQKSSRIYKVIYLVVMLFSIYYGMTSYTLLYEDSIKVSSPLSFNLRTYEYSDIESINVGVRKTDFRNYTPYYKIKFNDNKSINLFGGIMDEQKGKFFEDILHDLDKKLTSQGIIKNVSKKNFEKYSKGLDINYINKLEEVFE